ncbi:MAG: cation-transporting P-type ATPase [Candidatus Delongbacteria bacterium]|jgi:magnesium-transporting ATPase (P-type)|nr:cation-transporting P-type ATPase [Candidatus Delongbacteria bacterium]
MPQNESTEIKKPYAEPFEEVLRSFGSNEGGLSLAEAKERLEKYGLNKLPDPEKEGIFKRFFKHFNDTLIYVLLASAGITAIMGHIIDTGVILGVVVINAVIGFIQEGKAEQALEGIRKMLSLNAFVKRDGEWTEVNAEEIVKGDIVRIKSGNRAPADIRLIDTNNLRVDESALTGESVPADKNSDPVDADAGVGDRLCMAYSGTLVVSGRGVGVVTAAGMDTELGLINKMIGEVEELSTPLTKQMNSFGKVLSIGIVVMAVLLWLAGWFFHDYTTSELFLAAIGFAVAAIPEGLPAVLTITLALGVQRMAKRNAITRKLNAVETLGSVTIICSDKTGTLTKNEMTVKCAVAGSGSYSVSGDGYGPKGSIKLDDKEINAEDVADLKLLSEIMGACNDTDVTEEDGRWKIVGEPTEGAVLVFALKSGIEMKNFERIAEVPFESENKFMATLTGKDGKRYIYVKGAPDKLLDRCSSELKADGSAAGLDRKFWEEKISSLGEKGLRVLAGSYKEADGSKSEISLEDVNEGLIFAGLTGIIDPPRPEAIEAIKKCQTAGIRVKMITGDHAGTAKAIGLEMGIGDGKRAMTGEELEKASDEELRTIVKEYDIFARTSPEHKIRLVKALQANGEVVAMTGDGVNDAPALKRADVGISMGIKGSEATKEAADIVLADDNFASIEKAVEEGRTIYDNLRKAILFILPTNGAEGLVILGAVAFGLVLPVTPVQILWVNMVTAVTLALALSFEPSEPGIMERPPRDPKSSILTKQFLRRIVIVSVLIGGSAMMAFIYGSSIGYSQELARTIAVNTLVCGQVFYLFNSRYIYKSALSLKKLFANRIAWLTVGVLAVLQIIFVYAPFMQKWFGTESMEIRHWLLTLGIGASVFLLVELEKKIFRVN